MKVKKIFVVIIMIIMLFSTMSNTALAGIIDTIVRVTLDKTASAYQKTYKKVLDNAYEGYVNNFFVYFERDILDASIERTTIKRNSENYTSSKIKITGDIFRAEKITLKFDMNLPDNAALSDVDSIYATDNSTAITLNRETIKTSGEDRRNNEGLYEITYTFNKDGNVALWFFDDTAKVHVEISCEIKSSETLYGNTGFSYSRGEPSKYLDNIYQKSNSNIANNMSVESVIVKANRALTLRIPEADRPDMSYYIIELGGEIYEGEELEVRIELPTKGIEKYQYWRPIEIDGLQDSEEPWTEEDQIYGVGKKDESTRVFCARLSASKSEEGNEYSKIVVSNTYYGEDTDNEVRIEIRCKVLGFYVDGGNWLTNKTDGLYWRYKRFYDTNNFCLGDVEVTSPKPVTIETYSKTGYQEEKEAKVGDTTHRSWGPKFDSEGNNIGNTYYDLNIIKITGDIDLGQQFYVTFSVLKDSVWKNTYDFRYGWQGGNISNRGDLVEKGPQHNGSSKYYVTVPELRADNYGEDGSAWTQVIDTENNIMVLIWFKVRPNFNNLGNGEAIDWWKPTTNSGTVDNGRITTISNRIIGAIQVIGSTVSILALIVIGIKYVIASAEEKAKYKETSKAYIIGAVLIFATSNIAKFIFDFATGAFG